MIDDDADLLSREEDAGGGSAELARMDARILAAYRGEFGSRRRPWRQALRAVPAALLAFGLLAWAQLSLRGRPPEVAQPARQDAPLVTQTSLAGFEPVDEMEVNVLGGGVP